MAETTNGNKLIWWLLGIFSAFILLAVSVVVSKIDKSDVRISSIKENMAAMQESVKQIDELLRITRGEQVDKTVRFSDMSNRLNLSEERLIKVIELTREMNTLINTVAKEQIEFRIRAKILEEQVQTKRR